jgi:hypothetical protein
VNAVTAPGFSVDLDVTEHGTSTPSRPVNRRLSAVLTFRGLTPTASCAVQPTLWLNPWATHPLTNPGPWRRIEFHPTGGHVEHPATSTVAEILGLPERWPYEELTAAA